MGPRGEPGLQGAMGPPGPQGPNGLSIPGEPVNESRMLRNPIIIELLLIHVKNLA